MGSLPFARRGDVFGELGCRCARRYGCGESFAKVSRGNESVGWAVVVAISRRFCSVMKSVEPEQQSDIKILKWVSGAPAR